ncbi:hypothetical protein [Rhodococcus sp. IEGM 1307]|uniref:hypothetical protein n=1 Tax=Rhodococcus sp. IEGM 1307 TaxID=3047091 RepID=UPI0024B6BECC|nr:hypothetical protein [Rhodococcus sp. IEGM 1307]MDI9978806.1 hypothetical protein [Rhodococcus sp. IEGM 1307]
METSATVISIGAICFGLVVGFVTYRTLVFKEGASVSDIAAVVAALGGGVVTVWFDRAEGDSFAWYSIGLLAGMVVYYLHTTFRGTNDQKRKLKATQQDDGLPILKAPPK